MKSACIYKLMCPIKRQPIYVGSTSRSLKGRLVQHLWSAKSGSTKIAAYIRDNKIIPTIEKLDDVFYTKKKELREKEYYWVASLAHDGAPLLNIRTKTQDEKYEKVSTVKLNPRIVNRVRVHKKRTGIEMSKFIEIAILEKLEREKFKSDAITNGKQYSSL